MKFMNVAKKYCAVVVMAAVVPSAFAEAIDYSSLTGQIDATTIIAALLVIGASLATIYGAVKGLMLVINMIRARA